MQPNFPDHPVIRNMELTGHPDGKEPEPYLCPVCGEECEILYRQADSREIVGCNDCIELVDPENI